MIEIKVFSIGIMSTNAYVVKDADTGESLLVDPGCESSVLTAFLDSLPKGSLKYILLTHGHFDHIGGVNFYKTRYNAKVVVSEEDEEFLFDPDLNLSSMFSKTLESITADVILSDGEKLSLGNTEFEFMRTPGHTQGSGCYIFEDDKVIFSGDTLFYRSMGRTDFPTGNPLEMIQSLHKLCDLSGDYTVYPGHDMSTTLQGERENNPCF